MRKTYTGPEFRSFCLDRKHNSTIKNSFTETEWSRPEQTGSELEQTRTRQTSKTILATQKIEDFGADQTVQVKSNGKIKK